MRHSRLVSARRTCGIFVLCSRYLFITITLLSASHPHLQAQQLTTQAPPTLPDDPAPTSYPIAQSILPPPDPDSPVIESATQSYRDGTYTLDGGVLITYKGRTVQADHIVYDTDSGDLTATGHLVLSGGLNQERIAASHGTFNLHSSTGRFFDVTGSVGMRPANQAHRTVYTTASPFLFTGRLVVKTGPQNYDIYDGSVTSCALPNPDWLLSADHFAVAGDKASARNSVFHLLNLPVLFLPYVTHATDADARQTGFLIPTFGVSSTKGVTFGEQIYVVINRSTDLTVGAEYYSSRGFSQSASLRYRGAGLNFLTFRYNGLLDRRTGTANQGGEDVLLAGRRDFTQNTRAATNIDYLSSYVYREAFTDNFNQAVTSDIVSTAFLAHQTNGRELAGLADRYQGIKLIAQGTTPQQQVRIFHVPTLSFSTTDHRLGASGLELSLEASTSGLKRSQPNLVTGGIIERFDLHPQAAYPIALHDWHILPSVAARETLYSRSRLAPLPGQPAAESLQSLARSDFEFALAVRPPVLTRTFSPTHLTRILGPQLRHTIEPELTYHLTTGVSNFAQVLRFDATDVVANTNEAEYGVTQRLFRRSRNPASGTPEQPCQAQIAIAPGLDADPSSGPGSSGFDTPALRTSTSGCGSEEFISWRLTQKYFFDSTFGGAIVNGRRNIFETTLNLSGVAFLTEPRQISPLVSRLRVRTSALTDVEWDFDLDTGARKFTSSNLFADLHQGNAFAALAYVRLDAPGRFYTESPTPTATGSAIGVTSAISDFNQLRLLLGYGSPTKPGLSLAANTGLDLKSIYGATSTATSPTGVTTSNTVYPALLQYAALQTSYNWNCCGLAVEYRKFELGAVRNEGSYRFSFTLANVGAAGNLRRAERLF